MAGLARKHWPLFVVLAALWLAVAGVAWKSSRENDGRLIYGLDDAWIHMAIARNVAQHGVFGVTRHEFNPSSSSLLWTFLLSGVYAAAGVQELAPLALNVVFATGLVVLVHFVLSSRAAGLSPRWVFLVQVFLVFGGPVPAMVFIGMEHVLHALVAIAFTALAARELSREPGGPRGFGWWGLLLVCPLVATARYEGMFMGFVVFVLFLCRRRFAYGVVLGTLVMLPVVLFAAYSLRQGAHWLPNSLLKKGNIPDLSSARGVLVMLGGTAYRRCIRNPHVFFLVVAAAVGFALRYGRERGVWERGQVAAVVFVGTTLFHLQFSKVGEWFYRYDAYLVALGAFAIGWTLVRHLSASWTGLERARLPQYAAVAFLAFFPAFLLVKRGGLSLRDTPRVMRDRYLGHYQYGQFVREHYPNGRIVINDIGAMTFFSDARILDLYGLGSLKPLELAKTLGDGSRQDSAGWRKAVAAWAKAEGAQVAILQIGWETEVLEKIPEAWVKVGQWELPRNVEFPEDLVTAFYAVDPAGVDRLAASLKAFKDKLPRAVTQSGRYMQ